MRFITSKEIFYRFDWFFFWHFRCSRVWFWEWCFQGHLLRFRRFSSTLRFRRPATLPRLPHFPPFLGNTFPRNFVYRFGSRVFCRWVIAIRRASPRDFSLRRFWLRFLGFPDGSRVFCFSFRWGVFYLSVHWADSLGVSFLRSGAFSWDRRFEKSSLEWPNLFWKNSSSIRFIMLNWNIGSTRSSGIKIFRICLWFKN